MQIASARCDALRALDAPEKEAQYRDFWSGKLPGHILVNASGQKEALAWPSRPSDCDTTQGAYFRYHLACELARLDSRDWNADDAVPTLTVPVGPTGTIATAFGSDYDPTHDWTNQRFRTPEEMRTLRPPKLSDGLAGQYLDGVRFMAETVGDALPICFAQCLQGPLSTSAMILDDQVLLEAMYTHPRDIHALLDMVTDFVIAFAHEARGSLPRPVPTNFYDLYFPDGLGLCLSDDLAAVTSPWLYEEFVLPCMNRISDEFGGLVLHSCGNPAPVFPVWRQIHNLRGIEVGVTECDLAEAFRCFSGSTVIACHVGLNSEPHFASRLACVEKALEHFVPGSSVFLNATTHLSNLAQVSVETWNEESRMIVERVRSVSATAGGGGREEDA